MNQAETGPDFDPDADLVNLANTVRSFAAAEIEPDRFYFDESQEFPAGQFRDMGRLGFLGAALPEHYGGSGFGLQGLAVVVEELARVSPALALSVAVHSGLCISAVASLGTEIQRKQILPSLASASSLACWCCAEAATGNGLSTEPMRAASVQGGYSLAGSRSMVWHAPAADNFLASASVGTSASGSSLFLIPRSSRGLTTGHPDNKLGMRACVSATVHFDNVFVPFENRLGIEGAAGAQIPGVIAAARICTAALSVGLAQGALDRALDYVRQHSLGDKPPAESQAVLFKLADCGTAITAARLLTQKAAWSHDSGEEYTLQASLAKLHAAETAVKVVQEALQILGGSGYLKGNVVEMFYRDAKILTIDQGASEIEQVVIARQLKPE